MPKLLFWCLEVDASKIFIASIFSDLIISLTSICAITKFVFLDYGVENPVTLTLLAAMVISFGCISSCILLYLKTKSYYTTTHFLYSILKIIWKISFFFLTILALLMAAVENLANSASLNVQEQGSIFFGISALAVVIIFCLPFYFFDLYWTSYLYRDIKLTLKKKPHADAESRNKVDAHAKIHVPMQTVRENSAHDSPELAPVTPVVMLMQPEQSSQKEAES